MAPYAKHGQPLLVYPQAPPGQFAPYQQWQQKEPIVERQELAAPRHGIDWWTFLALCLTWMALVASSAILLYLTHWSMSARSVSGIIVTSDEIAATLLYTAVPILVATVLNEVLIERCWRRVVYVALGSRKPGRSNESLARSLRAANFDIFPFLQHAWKRRPAGIEWLAGISYCLLRWGTAVSISTVQLAVTWKSNTAGKTYWTDQRHAWLLLPVVLHALCIFGSFVIWMKPPWRLFSNRYSDAGLLSKYEPYLRRVQGGTLVNAPTIADHLERPRDLERELKTGRQMGAKIRGLWVGLLLMFTPPGLAWLLCRYTNFATLLTIGEMRMGLHLIFLVQNVCYSFALNFAIWNVSLDGLCRTLHGTPKPGLHFLGYSSGTILLFKALKVRRPIRASIFLGFFWLQACMMRGLTVFYAFCASALSYGLTSDFMAFADPYFWVAWVGISAVIAVPLFAVWVLTQTDSPVRPDDGWVWATIAKGALRGEGFYGVQDRQACWGKDVQPFRRHAYAGAKLL
ncbi:hypothetical protein AMS68_005310 [Peltaster fructicola]|uniref:Uncharacterized protein n=1 Tax=Peltaster fructicola TaxID=286661 RepID=A0A6H0XYG0_9PEZI|nr:hypothetical protein AMS68_005310 [Peltaster fructicola]